MIIFEKLSNPKATDDTRKRPFGMWKPGYNEMLHCPSGISLFNQFDGKIFIGIKSETEVFCDKVCLFLSPYEKPSKHPNHYLYKQNVTAAWIQPLQSTIVGYTHFKLPILMLWAIISTGQTSSTVHAYIFSSIFAIFISGSPCPASSELLW